MLVRPHQSNLHWTHSIDSKRALPAANYCSLRNVEFGLLAIYCDDAFAWREFRSFCVLCDIPEEWQSKI